MFLLWSLSQGNALGLSHAVDQLVPAEAHDGAHAEEEDTRAETLGGEVSLLRVSICLGLQLFRLYVYPALEFEGLGSFASLG